MQAARDTGHTAVRPLCPVPSEVNDAVTAVAGGRQQRTLALEDEQKKMEHSLAKGLEDIRTDILDRLDSMDGTRAGGGTPRPNIKN